MSDYNAPNPFAPPRAAVEDRPEADLPIELADPGKRLAAFCIDIIPGFVIVFLACILLLPILWPLLSSGGNMESGMREAMQESATRFIAVALMCFALGLGWGIYNIVLVYKYGQTFGKKIMDIRMVRTDGSRMSYARYFFLRNMVYYLLCAIPFIGWPIRIVDKLLIFRDSRQCLHDNIADTTVATAASSPYATLEGSRMGLRTSRG